MVSAKIRVLLFPGALCLATMLLLIATLAVSLMYGVQRGGSAALAQGDEIQVISQEVQNDFPNRIIFKLTATSPATIEEIRVFFKPVGSDRSAYGYMEIEPGKQVSGTYVMTTGIGSTHKPPGTLIRYSFEIRDAESRVFRTENKDFLYIDDSLEWKEISEGLLTVYYYGDFVEKRARTVLETAQKTMEDMGRVLGIKPKEPLRIVTYSNYRDMSRALPFRSQAVREDLQTEGQAYPPERVVLVLASDATFAGVASHEFTHLLVAEAAGRGYGLVPAWLNEGLAEYGNVDQTPLYDRALAFGIYTRRVKPLWYQSAFTGEPDDIIIAYGQAKSVVDYLISRYGEGKMVELMGAFRTSLSVDEALKKVYGFDQYGLDSQWRQALGLEPLPSPEELARQAAPTPEPTPSAKAEAAPAPTPETKATPEPPKASDEKPAPREARGRSATRSCSAPSRDTTGLPLDIAALAILGGPFLFLNARWSFGQTRQLHKLHLLSKKVKRGLHKFQGRRGR